MNDQSNVEGADWLNLDFDLDLDLHVWFLKIVTAFCRFVRYIAFTA